MPLIKQTHFAIFLISAFALWPTQSGAQSVTSTTLPLLGDSSEITSAAERRLGDRIARELYRDPDFIEDPVLTDYVQGIWQPLLDAARARGDLTPELDERFAWRIVMGRDRSVNAFALPGGYLGVHLGLIGVVSSRSELASVLGHELSHVTQRHIARLMAKSNQQTPWMIGAMILGALAASKNADAGNALIVGGQALAAQNQLNFSRDMEREADRVGFGVMTHAGFEAQGFVSMFDKLQQASRLNDSGAYPYLRSHPLTIERIADMQSRLPLGNAYPDSTVPTMPHAMLAARARVLSNSGVDALRAWQTHADSATLAKQPPAVQAGVLYGAALAASQLRDAVLARRQFDRLHAVTSADADAALQARWLGVEIALATPDLPQPQLLALADVLGTSRLEGSTPRRPALLLQAQIALRTGQPESLDAMAQRLQTWVALTPNDAMAWQFLSGIYLARGKNLRALRAEAEAKIANLDYAGALDRLKGAQDQLRTPGSSTLSSADHIDASIIDTRLRQIEASLGEQAIEK